MLGYGHDQRFPVGAKGETSTRGSKEGGMARESFSGLICVMGPPMRTETNFLKARLFSLIIPMGLINWRELIPGISRHDSYHPYHIHRGAGD
jgi:hypothetical protein